MTNIKYLLYLLNYKRLCLFSLEKTPNILFNRTIFLFSFYPLLHITYFRASSLHEITSGTPEVRYSPASESEAITGGPCSRGMCIFNEFHDAAARRPRFISQFAAYPAMQRLIELLIAIIMKRCTCRLYHANGTYAK